MFHKNISYLLIGIPCFSNGSSKIICLLIRVRFEWAQEWYSLVGCSLNILSANAYSLPLGDKTLEARLLLVGATKSHTYFSPGF